jgi:hypothetical protein
LLVTLLVKLRFTLTRFLRITCLALLDQVEQIGHAGCICVLSASGTTSEAQQAGGDNDC